MSEQESFLEAVLPRLEAADKRLHNGYADERIAMWSQADPVSLFGAAFTATGWTEIRPIFETLASRFSDCSSFEIEVLAAGASGDLAYTAGIERTTASVEGAPPSSYALRVTTIFRREGEEWKVIHRHADPRDDAGTEVAHRLRGDDAS